MAQAQAAVAQPSPDAIIRVRDITVQFGQIRVLDGLDLDVRRGEILRFVAMAEVLAERYEQIAVVSLCNPAAVVIAR